MKKKFILFILLLVPALVMAGDDMFTRALQKSMNQLGVSHGSKDLLIITNAGYGTFCNKGTESHADCITAITGCTRGQRNLLFYHTRFDAPLTVFIINSKTQSCIALRTENDKITITNIIDVSLNTVEKQDDRQKIIGSLNSLGRDAYRVTLMTQMYKAGAPSDYLKCVEFHDHLCPGVTSGYLISKYILKKFPATDGQSYIYIGIPNWCKEDAIAMILNATPGKRSLIIRDLPEKTKESLKNIHVAGIVILWDRKERKGTAIAISFNWDIFNALGGNESSRSISSRVKLLTASITYMDRPEKFVSVYKKISIGEKEKNQFIAAEGNPYRLFGFIE